MDNLNAYSISWRYPYQVSQPFFQQSAYMINLNTAVNELSTTKLKLSQSQKQIQKLKARVKQLEKQITQVIGKKGSNDRKKKKIIKKRKRNQTLNNQFECPYQSCQKAYASNLALNLHIKLKHNGGTKKERQTVAKMIIDAQENGHQKPQTNIEFPPNYIENYKKYLLIKNQLDK